MEKPWKLWEKYRDIKLGNRGKKKLFGVKTKLLYYKVSHRKSVGYTNEKNSDIHK